MFTLALGIFLFLSPIVFLLGGIPRLSGGVLALQFYQFGSLSLDNNIVQLQFFEYGVLALFIIALMQKQKRHFQDKYLGWFLGACFISVLIHPKTLPMMIPILAGALLFYLVCSYASSIKRLLGVVVIVSALNTLFAVLQFFGIHLIYQPTSNINGLMCISSHLGVYQALALPVCWYFSPYLAVIPLAGLLLSGNMTALIGGIVGMWYLIWRRIFLRGSVFFMLCGSLTALLSLRFFQVQKLTARVWVWGETFKEVINRPFSGYGIGVFGMTHIPLGHYTNPYNVYLGVAYSFGITALIILLFFIEDKFRVYKTGLSRAVFASCLAILVIGLGQSFMDFPRLAGTVIIMFALLKIKKEEECQQST